MSFSRSYIPYQQTHKFSSIILNYLEGKKNLAPFFAHTPDLDGVKAAIAARKKSSTNRAVLVNYLQQQYASVAADARVQANITSLLNQNTFTITTAHQPNIFTGHLYFIYKVLHVIKLAEKLSSEVPGNHYVPVYYMGSEDADLEELGEVTINGMTDHWQTGQKGAVGRMTIDASFIKIMNDIEAQIAVEPFGEEIMQMVKQAYQKGKTIEQATFEFVHALFGRFGLIVLLPDTAALKNEFSAVMQKELNEAFSAKAVAETIDEFPDEYKVQAAGRDINLFYLDADKRERIERRGDEWVVVNTTLKFSTGELQAELQQHPERFSPNVILRPVFQEVILPNIIFVGGGGELAYWLELKKVFEAVKVPYPVLVLRNSFLVADKKSLQVIDQLGMELNDFFLPVVNVIEKIVKKHSTATLSLLEEKTAVTNFYKQMQAKASAIDPTLFTHTEALLTKALYKIEQLEKKMFRAEKKKFAAAQRQAEKIKALLFPKSGLQERVENILPFYARYGSSFIDVLYENSLGLEQEFCILTEDA